MQFPATLLYLAEKPHSHSQTGNCLDWNYPFQAMSSNFGFNWQKRLPQELNMEFILNWIYPFQAISSKFTFSWQKSPLPVAKQRQFFRLNLSNSVNFQQLWVQLAVKLPPRAKQAKFLDWIYSFQAISSNFTFNCQLSSPSRGQTGKNLDWIYPFQEISSNFGFIWQ